VRLVLNMWLGLRRERGPGLQEGPDGLSVRLSGPSDDDDAAVSVTQSICGDTADRWATADRL
jgi:hypothetical protein